MYNAYFMSQYISQNVWGFVQQFVERLEFNCKILAYVGGKYVPVPVNIDTVNALFGTELRPLFGTELRPRKQNG